MFNKKLKRNKGFTLIELMVASSIFLVVMLIVSGSIVSIFDANQKSKNLRSVMDNLNLALESMTRTIRFGKNYHCGSSGDLSQPQDCAGGSTALTVRAVDGVQTTYSLSGNRISRTLGGQANFLTSPDVTITSLNFWVLGTNPFPDTLQPKVIVTISGYVGSKATTRSTFNLETTISQRTFDFQ